MHKVKYWAVGNEVWGPWQVEETTKEAYAFKAWQWAKALKLLDPTITLVFCGMTGTNSWDWHVINQCCKNANHSLVDRDGSGQLMDMLAVHIYTASEMHVPNVMSAYIS
jgi:alpha-N-arabinofuranosidase